MENTIEGIIEDIKNSNIWETIHSTSDLEKILVYLKDKTLDYSPFDNMIKFILYKYDLDISNINSNFIVSIIMIYRFADELIGKNRVEEENIIVDKATQIYELILNNNNENNLHKKLVTFKILFDNWKNKDKEQQLDILSEMYYQYSKSIDEVMDDESKTEYVKELITLKQKILVSMRSLTVDYRDYLDNYKFKNAEYDSKVNKMIYTKLKYVYWENIRKYIFNDSNTDIFYRIINDYKELINEIKVIVDMSILDSLAEYDVNDNNLVQGCVAISKAFIDINKQIDSENYDEIYDMVSNKISDNNKYIIDGYKLCFDRLEIIKKIKMNVQINTT